MEVLEGYCCPMCADGEIFNTLTEISAHHVQEHKKVETPKVGCRFCSYTSEVGYAVREHVLSHNPGNEFRCLHCHTSFASEEICVDHIKAYHRDKSVLTDPYACDECTTRFISEEFVKMHALFEHRGLEQFSKCTAGQSRRESKDASDSSRSSASFQAIPLYVPPRREYRRTRRRSLLVTVLTTNYERQKYVRRSARQTTSTFGAPASIFGGPSSNFGATNPTNRTQVNNQESVDKDAEKTEDDLAFLNDYFLR